MTIQEEGSDIPMSDWEEQTEVTRSAIVPSKTFTNLNMCEEGEGGRR